MNEVKLFNFEEHEVRTLIINDEPYFVLRLNYENDKLISYEREM